MKCIIFSNIALLFCSVDVDVKSLNNRTSGQAFEIILNSQADLSPDRPQSLYLAAQKKEPSLENLQKKLDDAEERRRVRSVNVTLIIYISQFGTL